LQNSEENKITFEGGCGDSFERAVVIKGAPTHLDGVRAEYQYFAENLGPGGWTIVGQALCTHLGRQYDKMDIKPSDGTQGVVFFEITDFFEKK